MHSEFHPKPPTLGDPEEYEGSGSLPWGNGELSLAFQESAKVGGEILASMETAIKGGKSVEFYDPYAAEGEEGAFPEWLSEVLKTYDLHEDLNGVAVVDTQRLNGSAATFLSMALSKSDYLSRDVIGIKDNRSYCIREMKEQDREAEMSAGTGVTNAKRYVPANAINSEVFDYVIIAANAG